MNIPYFYKAFCRKEFAINFVENGEMRFGSLDYYKNIEDETRRDETEGCCQFFFPGNRTIALDDGGYPDFSNNQGITCVCMVPSTACFAFCVSDHTVDLNLLREKGEFIVKIYSPDKLLEDIKECCNYNTSEWPYREYFFVTLQDVHYTKGTDADDSVSDLAMLALCTCQKPSTFSHEKEYRYLLDSNIIKDNIAADHIIIKLDKKLDYCELI